MPSPTTTAFPLALLVLLVFGFVVCCAVAALVAVAVVVGFMFKFEREERDEGACACCRSCCLEVKLAVLEVSIEGKRLFSEAFVAVEAGIEVVEGLFGVVGLVLVGVAPPSFSSAIFSCCRRILSW